MNISTVNELIASLESAGELSIREQKFLKLAKAFKQLAAENVALKAEQVRIFNSGYLRGHDSTVEGYYVDIHQDDITTYHEDIVAEISQEQTPVTDRFVAGIKADGVEMFVEKCREKSMSAISSDIRNNWWLAGEHANDLAKQLREGADK
ncbi:hypothetical protein [Klebsiella pneumoniae]|uniref:hypothetical protein n=1 Tax=Klebsiella pneumoniae TaxID=573 RepID=UPI0021D0B7D0|nr:hypothetical protein [Klebsiella pneumoniae]MCP6434269.1 hypothetical protein [Klebsiella pneumoniae]MCU6586109.1 hypothetical protein [Klebsiella pneumoniae]